MAFKSQLCLAQEGILEKSLLDCTKPGIVTKVCGQVVEYYKQALKQLEMSGAREMSDHMDNLLDIVGNRQSKGAVLQQPEHAAQLYVGGGGG